MQRAKREKESRECAANANLNDFNFNNFSNSLLGKTY